MNRKYVKHNYAFLTLLKRSKVRTTVNPPKIVTIALAISTDKIPSDEKTPTIAIPTKHQNLREPKNDKSLIIVLLLVYKRPFI